MPSIDLLSSVKTPKILDKDFYGYQDFQCFYFRILKYIKPDFVHVLMDGKIVAEGGAELANKLEEHGYGWVEETQSSSHK